MLSARRAVIRVHLSLPLRAALEAKADELSTSIRFVVCQALHKAWGMPLDEGDLQSHDLGYATSAFDDMLAAYGCTRPRVARALRITRSAVEQWAMYGKRPAPKHAIRAEELLGIPRWELRPDLWPPPAGKIPRTRKPRPATTATSPSRPDPHSTNALAAAPG